MPLTTLERLQKAVGLPPKQDFHFCGLLTYHPSTDEERAASPRWREAHEVHRSAEILTAVPAVPGVGEQQRGHPSSGVVPTVRCVRDPWATEPVAPPRPAKANYNHPQPNSPRDPFFCKAFHLSILGLDTLGLAPTPHTDQYASNFGATHTRFAMVWPDRCTVADILR